MFRSKTRLVIIYNQEVNNILIIFSFSQGIVQNGWQGLTFIAMDLLEPFGMQYASAVEVIYFVFEATVTEENSYVFGYVFKAWRITRVFFLR